MVEQTRRLFWIVALVGFGGMGCGGAQTPSSSSAPAAPAAQTSAQSKAAVAPAPPSRSPWTGLDAAALGRLVTEQATARLREAQPNLDPAQIASWRANPAQAPAFGGRAVERLFELAQVDFVAGRLDDAETMIRLLRARAKNRNSAYLGTTLLAEIRRRKAGDDPAAQERAIEGVLGELPRARFGPATVVFRLYQNEQQLAAQLEQIHQQMVSLETASGALFFEQILPAIVRNRDRFLAAVGAVQRRNDARPADRPYAFSTVDLTRARDAHPVVVAVWDTGVNLDLFAAQRFTNPREQPNGQDDDGNGLIDDLSGVADMGEPHTRLLFDPGAATIERYKPFLRGIMDLRAGLASTPAAEQVLALVRSVTDARSLIALEQSLDAVGEWAHGTHVAGLLLAGNPHAKLAAFRSAWAGEARPYFHRGPTDAELDAERGNVEAIAAFVRAHGIRVVNASLGFSVDYLEDQLRYERERYRGDDEVRARARAIQARREANWRWVFAQCPDTLFVVSAGNSNRDVLEYGDVPTSIAAPNALSVGAVDRFGAWATFTNSNPERVRVFDHGVEAESVIPSGERLPLSGTSMSSPNVANLAGKMYAVDPNLTPTRAIQIIVETGDPIAPPFDGRIANERRAIERVRRERGRGAPAGAAGGRAPGRAASPAPAAPAAAARTR